MSFANPKFFMLRLTILGIAYGFINDFVCVYNTDEYKYTRIFDENMLISYGRIVELYEVLKTYVEECGTKCVFKLSRPINEFFVPSFKECFGSVCSKKPIHLKHSVTLRGETSSKIVLVESIRVSSYMI